jgi:hypothetical protein
MEKDITILKSLIEDLKREEKLIGYDAEIEIQAIENLIKGYRELEKENNKFRNGEIVTPKSEAKVRETVFNNFKNDLKNYISKSKVKEKIEELKKMNLDCDTFGSMRDYAVLILQELMEV